MCCSMYGCHISIAYGSLKFWCRKFTKIPQFHLCIQIVQEAAAAYRGTKEKLCRLSPYSFPLAVSQPYICLSSLAV